MKPVAPATETMPPSPESWARAALPPSITLVILIVAWLLATELTSDPYNLFPGPWDVALSLAHLLFSAQLAPNLAITLQRIGIGYLISLTIGGALATAMSLWPPVHAGLKPYLLGFQSLPSIAWVPLAVIWFGIEESSYIFITVIGSVFSAAIAFTDALRVVHPAHVLAARNMGSHGLGLVLRVRVPASLPALVSGAKQCWSFAWRSLLGAEIVSLSIGLGFLLNSGRDFGDTSQVIAIMVITLALGLLFELLFFTRVEVWVRRRWGLA